MRGLMITVGAVVFIAGVLALLLMSGTLSTRYAPTYSESGFKQVKLGMGTNEVLKLAGKPLFDPSGESSYWLYTTCNNTFWTFKRRWLRIGNGRVEAIINDVAVD